MGTKYIIEVEDKPFELLSEDGFTSEKLFRVKGFNSLVFDWNGLNMLTPYTEPDMEQIREEANNTGYKIGYEKGYRDGVNTIGDAEDKIRKEAYDKGFEDGKELCPVPEVCHDSAYQKGLSDAWEAAKKIVIGDINIIISMFGTASRSLIIRDLTATKVIERMKAYEQERDAEIKVGDEVKNTQTGVKFIVTHLWENNRGEQGVSGFNQECSAFSTTLSLVVKTGRHFPEISTVLEKMRNEPNAQIDT